MPLIPMSELDEMIDAGWGDVPRVKIPDNWRTIRFDDDTVAAVDPLRMEQLDLPLDPSIEIARKVMANEISRRRSAIYKERTANRYADIRDRMAQKRREAKVNNLMKARKRRWA